MQPAERVLGVDAAADPDSPLRSSSALLMKPWAGGRGLHLDKHLKYYCEKHSQWQPPVLHVTAGPPFI
jgi:hypothetical protein